MESIIATLIMQVFFLPLISSKIATDTVEEDIEKNKSQLSKIFGIPVIWILSMWIIEYIKVKYNFDFERYGIYPLTIKGLRGIVLTPFIHGDYKHLFNNSLPLFFLSSAIFYFYKELSFKVIILIYFTTGICVWFGGRPAYHIGASGLVYGYASFLFFSGLIRKYPRLIAISLLVSFLYGSLIWGVFPYTEEISWESHLWGLLSGLSIALFYKDYGPQRKKFEWEDDDDNEYDNIEIRENDEYLNEQNTNTTL